MPRAKRDGTPARPARRRKLTELFVRNVRAEAAAFAVWDSYQRGLCLRVQPTGQKSWKAVYSLHGKARWLHIGDANAIGLTNARRIAAVNPCKGIERHATQSRERILAGNGVPQFWSAFEDAGLVRASALKTLLLTGQRPGEVTHMRHEHVADGWWTMPGKPDAKIGW